ncbi:MAG: hypothetical protein ACOYXB_15730 [Bacteroidota bacterium]
MTAEKKEKTTCIVSLVIGLIIMTILEIHIINQPGNAYAGKGEPGEDRLTEQTVFPLKGSISVSKKAF